MNGFALTAVDGSRVIVNLDQVEVFEEVEGGTVVRYLSGREQLVREGANDISGRLSGLAAPRTVRLDCT